MFLIEISAALWGQNIASQCNSLTGALTQALTNDRAQCQYTDAAIGIGCIFGYRCNTWNRWSQVKRTRGADNILNLRLIAIFIVAAINMIHCRRFQNHIDIND